MSRHGFYHLDVDIRSLARAYAQAFNPDSGDSIVEYAERASFDVFPASVEGCRQERAEFRRTLRANIRMREMAA